MVMKIHYGKTQHRILQLLFDSYNSLFEIRNLMDYVQKLQNLLEIFWKLRPWPWV